MHTHTHRVPKSDPKVGTVCALGALRYMPHVAATLSFETCNSLNPKIKGGLPDYNSGSSFGAPISWKLQDKF